jgi:hypothetical protein
MTRRAVIDPVTGRVKRWGDTDFTGQLTGGDTQTIVGDGAIPLSPLHYQKVVGSAFVTMTVGERAAVDAQLAAIDDAQLPTALQAVTRRVASPAALPVPPPRQGLLVAIGNTGGGSPGLAYSTLTGWVVLTGVPFP